MTTETKKETESVLVKMNDGRSVEFTGKQRMKKESYVQDGELRVRFDFLDGQTLTYTLPPTLYQRFALHGAEQKLGDEAAGEKTAEDMYEAVSALAARLNGPDGWTVSRQGGGFGGAGVVVRAVMELKSKSREEVNAWIESIIQKNPGETRQKVYAKLRATDALKPIIARLEAEKSKGDTTGGEDLLAAM